MPLPQIPQPPVARQDGERRITSESLCAGLVRMWRCFGYLAPYHRSPWPDGVFWNVCTALSPAHAVVLGRFQRPVSLGRNRQGSHMCQPSRAAASKLKPVDLGFARWSRDSNIMCWLFYGVVRANWSWRPYNTLSCTYRILNGDNRCFK